MAKLLCNIIFGAVIAVCAMTHATWSQTFDTPGDTMSRGTQFEALSLDSASIHDTDAQTGLRFGQFRVDPLIEAGISHSDGDTISNLRGAATIQSQWSVHELRLDTEADISSQNWSDDTDIAFQTSLSGRRDISDRVNFTGELRLNYNHADGEQDELQYGASASLSVSPGPLTFALRGSLDIQNVGDPVGGSDTSNDFQQLAAELRIGYREEAMLSPYIQASASDQQTGLISGLDGDASLWQIRTGLQINRGDKLRGDVSLGAAYISTNDAQRDDLASFIWSASLVWSPVRLTSVTLDAATELGFSETTNLADTDMTSGVRTSQVGVRVSRDFNYRLDGFASTSYSHVSYGSLDRSDESVVLQAGLTYDLTPDSSLIGQVSHERSWSSGSDQDEEDEQSNTVSLRFQLRR